MTQLSFDDPRPIVSAPGASAVADPLVSVLEMHEQAKVQVNAATELYVSIDFEFMSAKRARDEMKVELDKLQSAFDSAARSRHEQAKRREQALEIMRTVEQTAKEMGGIPHGNNRFVTPDKDELFKSGLWKQLPREVWESMP